MKINSVMQLLFPIDCLICDFPAVEICERCAFALFPVPSFRTIDEIPHWAGAYYGDHLAKIILLAKEENNRAARNILVSNLVAAFMQSDVIGPLTFVPLPSRKEANRRRGYLHAQLIAQGLSLELKKDFGISSKVLQILRVNRRIQDQSNLGRNERIINLDGAYESTKLPRDDHGPLVLVDDLVTTGTTVREALRALRYAGLRPALVISAGVSGRGTGTPRLPNKIGQ
jgi:predicted amidophosphoribosyltransferase